MTLRDIQDKEAKQHFGLCLLSAFERAFKIARKINYKKEETNKQLERLVGQFNPNSSTKKKITVHLIKLAISHKKEFSDNFFKELLLICEESAGLSLSETKFKFARTFLQQADNIEKNILKKPTKKWQISIAESYITEAGDMNDPRNFNGPTVLLDAMTAFQRLGDKEKVEEISLMYETLKKNIQFDEISHNVDMEPVKEEFKKLSEIIAKMSSEDILKYLTASEGLYPTSFQVKQRGKELSEKFILRQLLGKTFYDHNMNLANYSNSDDDNFFGDYKPFLDFDIMYIDILFEKIVSEGKVTWSDTKKFIKKHSWFGGKYEILSEKDNAVTIEKWINLLGPGLKLYFTAAKKFYKSNGNKYPAAEIMLATESLTLKIEGFIRESFKKRNLSTSASEQIKGDKTIIKERDLNSFLRDEKSIEIFGEDLVVFMKAVLVEKQVFNLRNNIAHCLLWREHFQLEFLHLLLIIILRIGNCAIAENK